MRPQLIGVMAVASTLVGSTLNAQVTPGAAPFKGRLYAAALNSEARSLRPVDVSLVAPALRSRFQRFLKCQSAFRSRLPKPKGFFGESVWPKHQAIEREISCLIETPAELAADYAAHARILYEWEGLASSPLEEARFAESYIEEHQDSPLKPYLYLFIAHRLRYAFEFLAIERRTQEMMVISMRYRSFIARARLADPMIALVADDLDALPFVSHDVAGHPGNF